MRFMLAQGRTRSDTDFDSPSGRIVHRRPAQVVKPVERRHPLFDNHCAGHGSARLSCKLGLESSNAATSQPLICCKTWGAQRRKDNVEIGANNNWCERGDSNPHGFTRQILSLVRLPIPPLSHFREPTHLIRLPA